jgi:hypothetical protein
VSRSRRRGEHFNGQALETPPQRGRTGAEGEANISMDKRSRHRRSAVGRDAEEANMATRDEEMI